MIKACLNREFVKKLRNEYTHKSGLTPRTCTYCYNRTIWTTSSGSNTYTLPESIEKPIVAIVAGLSQLKYSIKNEEHYLGSFTQPFTIKPNKQEILLNVQNIL